MAIFSILHEVKDFDNWKKYFDLAQDMRKSAEHIVKGVFRDNDNPNLVLIVFEADNPEIVKGMMKDQGFKEKMAEAGVQGEVKIWTADNYL